MSHDYSSHMDTTTDYSSHMDITDHGFSQPDYSSEPAFGNAHNVEYPSASLEITHHGSSPGYGYEPSYDHNTNYYATETTNHHDTELNHPGFGSPIYADSDTGGKGVNAEQTCNNFFEWLFVIAFVGGGIYLFYTLAML